MNRACYIHSGSLESQRVTLDLSVTLFIPPVIEATMTLRASREIHAALLICLPAHAFCYSRLFLLGVVFAIRRGAIKKRYWKMCVCVCFARVCIDSALTMPA
jgi:hypothetical protein